MVSSQTRNWTSILCIARWVLNHWTTRKRPSSVFVTEQKPMVRVMPRIDPPSSSLKQLDNNIWCTFIAVFTEIRLTPDGNCCPQVFRLETDWTRRMMMLTPETSSCYLTTNQLEEHELIRHPATHIPNVVFFKTKQNKIIPFPESNWGVWIFWAWAAHSSCLRVYNKGYPFLHSWRQ